MELVKLFTAARVAPDTQRVECGGALRQLDHAGMPPDEAGLDHRVRARNRPRAWQQLSVKELQSIALAAQVLLRNDGSPA